MASRNPLTGDNWSKAEEVEFNKGVFADNLARFESMSPKELGATGPSHPGMGTLFSPDRWQAYIDWLRKAGMEAEAEQLENAVVEKVETKIIAPELTWDEDATDAEIAADVKAYDEGGPYVESDPDDALTIEWKDKVGRAGNVGQRNLSGNRDANGNLLTAEDEALTAKIRADQEKFKDKWTGNPLTADRAGETRDANKEAINKKWAKRREDIAAAVEAAKQKDLHSAREEASLENVPDWLGQSEGAISDEDRDRLVQEDVAREAAEFDAQLEDADSDRAMMEADVDADILDADYETREFPYQAMSDEDKGMFTYKKTESKEDKNIDAGINVITQDTGMNEQQARQLMTKLKGICG